MLFKKYNLEIELNSFFQLAAVATAADLVPLINENRLLVFLGLKAMNKSSIPPFQLLFEKLNTQNNYSVGDLIFKIAPRINAAGRMDSASVATNFLMSNISPQNPSFNRGGWKKLESLVRMWSRNKFK